MLTKALGTGLLMAAAVRGKAKGRWVMAACASMQRSNAAAAACLARHGATGCTDVTGFGLLGHLAEMAKASKVSSLELPCLCYLEDNVLLHYHMCSPADSI